MPIFNLEDPNQNNPGDLLYLRALPPEQSSPGDIALLEMRVKHLLQALEDLSSIQGPCYKLARKALERDRRLKDEDTS